MFRWLKILISGVLVSAYLFPIEFMFLRGVNTKMMLALLGIVLVLFDMLQGRSLRLGFGHIRLFFCALSVSLASLLSITVNQTPDTSYVSYVGSFFVWLGAAYSVCWLLKWMHGDVTLVLLTDYLAGVCVLQCLAAIIIEYNPQVASFVDTWIFQDQNLLHKVDRLYGLGASLDNAGVRFSEVMVLLTFTLFTVEGDRLRNLLYILSIFVLVVVGCMISRTTLVGVGFSFLAFILLPLSGEKTVGKFWEKSLFGDILILFVPFVVLCVFLYNVDVKARYLFQFAFEGFFSLFNDGTWTVGSNEILKTMVVFPESLHTWIIGDGYFNNSMYDVNYLGNATKLGYYMGTDIGYLRFLFYFGTIGLLCMLAVILQAMFLSIDCFPSYKWLFIFLMAVGLIVWGKVATDVFFIFALFISCAMIKDGTTADYAQG